MALLPLLAACAEEREYPHGVECFSWKEDLGAVVGERCATAECHGGSMPAGDYGLTSYLEALGDGSDDEPNAISGDAMSLILTTLDPATADETHRPFAEELLPMLRTWVVDCELEYTDSPIHEAGILNRRSDDFHGKLLRSTLYDFERCAECHGEDFSGGTSGVACLTCHENGPTDCTTCHSRLLEQGAHAAHVPDPPTFGTECETCHVVPTAWDVDGHIFLPDGTLDPAPPEVTLSGKAAEDGPSESREGEPTYDPEAGQCSNVYCHGDTYADGALDDTLSEPVWTAADQAECGTCHLLPPSNHGLDDCALCHSQVIDSDMTFVAPELHVDTMVQVGPEGAGECNGCHGSGDSGAPPPDLSGNTDPTILTVGAHQAHLGPPFQLRGPVACGDCHLVPDEVDSPGHIDDPLPADVFPAAISGDSLAFVGTPDGGAATPRWDRDTATCSDVYCHGGGPLFEGDTSAGLMTTPSWTSPFEGTIYCGSCHGMPPEGPGPLRGFEHLSEWTVTDCATGGTCHAGSVDPFGNILFEGPADAPTSLHMNGVVDVE